MGKCIAWHTLGIPWQLKKSYRIILFLKNIYDFFSAFLAVLYMLKQGWANYGPRAACGPRDHFMRPAGTCKNFTYCFNLTRYMKKYL